MYELKFEKGREGSLLFRRLAVIEERAVTVVVMIWLIDVLHATFLIKTKIMYVEALNP